MSSFTPPHGKGPTEPVGEFKAKPSLSILRSDTGLSSVETAAENTLSYAEMDRLRKSIVEKYEKCQRWLERTHFPVYSGIPDWEIRKLFGNQPNPIYHWNLKKIATVCSNLGLSLQAFYNSTPHENDLIRTVVTTMASRRIDKGEAFPELLSEDYINGTLNLISGSPWPNKSQLSQQSQFEAWYSSLRTTSETNYSPTELRCMQCSAGDWFACYYNLVYFQRKLIQRIDHHLSSKTALQNEAYRVSTAYGTTSKILNAIQKLSPSARAPVNRLTVASKAGLEHELGLTDWLATIDLTFDAFLEPMTTPGWILISSPTYFRLVQQLLI